MVTINLFFLFYILGSISLISNGSADAGELLQSTSSKFASTSITTADNDGSIQTTSLAFTTTRMFPTVNSTAFGGSTQTTASESPSTSSTPITGKIMLTSCSHFI